MSDSITSDVRSIVIGYRDSILESGLEAVGEILDVKLVEGSLSVSLRLGFPAKRYARKLQASLAEPLHELPGVDKVTIDFVSEVAAAPVQGQVSPLNGVKNVIAVASGKGGVGKSTTTVNLALALAEEGARVGVLDADIYGPSQPRMLGLAGRRPTSPDGSRLDPLIGYGIQCMSIGFLVDEDEAVVWRGPMATSALAQLLGQTLWDELDYLIVDMPPGTGDIQLTLSQQVPVSGAVIVTTPQDIALQDAIKGLRMFQKVDIPVLGIVENMSMHVCSNCGHQDPIFGEGGAARMAETYGLPILGGLPLDGRIREEADSGRPSVASDPDSSISAAYLEVARRTTAKLAELSGAGSQPFPEIIVEDD
ncbi:MAG: iron-sulfur cluster carrier protein ApbC [Gammaproteobacteria bacterium]|nr:MAG: iron-sulfur cluster carrier protein ApbC [Gammaproteobacteria bacterium]